MQSPFARWIVGTPSWSERAARASNFRAEEAAADGPFAIVTSACGSYSPGVAAILAVDLIRRYSRPRDASDPGPRLLTAFTKAHEAIGKARSLDGPHGYYEGLAASAVAAELGPSGLSVVHVGDARVLRVREGVAAQLTVDHLHAVHTKHANVLAQALGSGDIAPAAARIEVLAGDTLVICSRRSTDAILARADALGSDDLEAAADELAALSGGALAITRT